MTMYAGRLACVRCGAEVDDAAPWRGCPSCLAAGRPSNVLPVYDLVPGGLPVCDEPGVFRYRGLLPVDDATRPVGLHEGGTPLVEAPRLADELDIGSLWFKDETRNPTWSYKDRLAAVAVAVARSRGVDTVALSTTGNHGAAAAAYAAAAGLRCVALTLTSVPTTMKVLMQSYGAEVVALDSPPDRWALLAQAVDVWGWMPISGFVDPPLGSNPFGVDGYKTIAYEIHETLGDVPDVVVVPAAYADGLAGTQRGFADLVALGLVDRAPRMVAVDPFGAYAAALESGEDAPVPVSTTITRSFSIATPVATQQGVAALRASGGLAAAEADDDVVMGAQRTVAQRVGLYLEASSALCVPAVRQLRKDGRIGAEERVVCLATSTGLKDVGATAERLPAVPTIGPELSELAEHLGLS